MFPTVSFFVFALLCVLSKSHPIIQHHFNNVVNSNNCLKECMDKVASSELELSILKRANISGFLLDLETICAAIKDARECISNCNVGSNPFALQSMTTICETEVHEDVKELKKCLQDEGDNVFEDCKEQCGDFESINNEVHLLTMSMKPDDHKMAQKIMQKTDKGCSMLKCSSRCSVAGFNNKCNKLDNGKNPGNMIQSLIEKVLIANRKDLDKLALTDTMAQTTPSQCNYMYAPEVMFNPLKDKLHLHVVQNIKREIASGPQKSPEDTVSMIRHKAHNDINYTFQQLHARLLQKQFLILDEQEQNIKKESKKLDMEIALLERRNSALGDTSVKQHDSV